MKVAMLSALLSSSGLGLTAQETRLQLVSDESTLSANVKATAHDFEAKATSFQCDLTVDRKSGLPTDARIQFDLENVKTGNEDRDREMLEWLQYEEHPHVEARLLSVEVGPETTAVNVVLAMNGHENNVIVPLTVSQENKEWLVAGEVTIDHRQWGLPKIRKFLLLTVDPLLEVRFRLRFREPES